MDLELALKYHPVTSTSKRSSTRLRPLHCPLTGITTLPLICFLVPLHPGDGLIPCLPLRCRRSTWFIAGCWSTSPFVFPAGVGFYFMGKKDKTVRPCIKYPYLNDITIKNRYPLPLISSALEILQGVKIFSKLDLRNAYHLVRIREGDEWRIALNTKQALQIPRNALWTYKCFSCLSGLDPDSAPHSPTYILPPSCVMGAVTCFKWSEYFLLQPPGLCSFTVNMWNEDRLNHSWVSCLMFVINHESTTQQFSE